jgi:hypothetical protein
LNKSGRLSSARAIEPQFHCVAPVLSVAGFRLCLIAHSLKNERMGRSLTEKRDCQGRSARGTKLQDNQCSGDSAIE